MAFVEYSPDFTTERINSMAYNRAKFLAGQYPSLFDHGKILQNIEIYENTLYNFLGGNPFEGERMDRFRAMIPLRYLDDLIEELQLRADLITKIPKVNCHSVYSDLKRRFPKHMNGDWRIGEA